MEKLALAVSPSKSAIWTVKSSFSSGAGRHYPLKTAKAQRPLWQSVL
jgi:hypothetical protein